MSVRRYSLISKKKNLAKTIFLFRLQRINSILEESTSFDVPYHVFSVSNLLKNNCTVHYLSFLLFLYFFSFLFLLIFLQMLNQYCPWLSLYACIADWCWQYETETTMPPFLFLCYKFVWIRLESNLLQKCDRYVRVNWLSYVFQTNIIET